VLLLTVGAPIWGCEVPRSRRAAGSSGPDLRVGTWAEQRRFGRAAQWRVGQAARRRRDGRRGTTAAGGSERLVCEQGRRPAGGGRGRGRRPEKTRAAACSGDARPGAREEAGGSRLRAPAARACVWTEREGIWRRRVEEKALKDLWYRLR
jgi:hypothetical protein